MKNWKDVLRKADVGPPEIDDICPVCKRPVEMNRNSVLDTDVRPWQLYHKVCYRMSHPTEKRRP